MSTDRPIEIPDQRQWTEANFIESSAAPTDPEDEEFSDDGYLSKLTDQQLLLAIPRALEKWTNVNNSRKESLAGRREWHEYTTELERRYPLSSEPLPPFPA